LFILKLVLHDSSNQVGQSMTTQPMPSIPLPKAWNAHVKAAVLHVTSLARYATCYTRGWAADGCNPRVRQQAQVDRLNQEVAAIPGSKVAVVR